MLGALIGDIIGSIYEFNNHRSKEFPFFGNDVEFTDDSVCTIALASAILSQSAPTPVMQDWCRRYLGRGYGGMFNRWINNPAPLPYNSYGNGAAMRVSSAAWLGGSLEDALALSDHITQITHNHAEGMKGARATCHAIYMALHGMSAEQIRSTVQATYEYDLSQSVDEIRPAYYFNETCQETVPQAIICALNADSFEDAIRNAISIGGDSDTVAAIAGSIAEPLFGIPEEIATQALDCLPQEFLDIIVLVCFRHTELENHRTSSSRV